jgi:hypothetical protein
VSGKPIKKKSEQVGQTAPAEVNAPEAPIITPTVTGHYQPLIQPSTPPQPAPATSGLTESIITLSVTDDAMDAEQLENVRNQILGQADDEKPTSMVVLLVQAVSPNGFYRAGQFWPHAGVHAFVDTELEVDILAPYISVAVAERLKAEPHLRVTVVDAITTEDPEA